MAELTSSLAAAAKPIATGLVEALVAPWSARVADWAKEKETDRKLLKHRLNDAMTSHIERVYTKASILKSIVFPNQQLDLTALYQPLTVSTHDPGDSFTGFDPKLFSDYRRLLVRDYAGMGKSTLTSWLARGAIESGTHVPIIVELRRLSPELTLLDLIFSDIDPIGQIFDRDLLMRLLNVGEFLILLDGYDELSLAHQEIGARQIRDLVEKAPDNLFVMTSRPEASLAAFADFQRFAIKPLTQEEAVALVYRYDRVSPTKIGRQLAKEMRNAEEVIQTFLENPFLVSLLYKSYLITKHVPEKKVAFYEEVYGALFKHHDLSKDAFKRDKRCGLDILEFRCILRELAFAATKEGRVSYTEPVLHDQVAKAGARQAISLRPADFCDDMILAVPLFQKEGQTYRWAHKSLADYFTAEYIAFSEEKSDILRAIYSREAERFIPVLELFRELDWLNFARDILRPLLVEFLAHCDRWYAHGWNDQPILVAAMFGRRCAVRVSTEAQADAPDWPGDAPFMPDRGVRMPDGLEVVQRATFKASLSDVVLRSTRLSVAAVKQEPSHFAGHLPPTDWEELLPAYEGFAQNGEVAKSLPWAIIGVGARNDLVLDREAVERLLNEHLPAPDEGTQSPVDGI